MSARSVREALRTLSKSFRSSPSTVSVLNRPWGRNVGSTFWVAYSRYRVGAEEARSRSASCFEWNLIQQMPDAIEPGLLLVIGVGDSGDKAAPFPRPKYSVWVMTQFGGTRWGSSAPERACTAPNTSSGTARAPATSGLPSVSLIVRARLRWKLVTRRGGSLIVRVPPNNVASCSTAWSATRWHTH